MRTEKDMTVDENSKKKSNLNIFGICALWCVSAIFKYYLVPLLY